MLKPIPVPEDLCFGLWFERSYEKPLNFSSCCLSSALAKGLSPTRHTRHRSSDIHHLSEVPLSENTLTLKPPPQLRLYTSLQQQQIAQINQFDMADFEAPSGPPPPKVWPFSLSFSILALGMTTQHARF